MSSPPVVGWSHLVSRVFAIRNDLPPDLPSHRPMAGRIARRAILVLPFGATVGRSSRPVVARNGKSRAPQPTAVTAGSAVRVLRGRRDAVHLGAAPVELVPEPLVVRRQRVEVDVEAEDAPVGVGLLDARTREADLLHRRDDAREQAGPVRVVSSRAPSLPGAEAVPDALPRRGGSPPRGDPTRGQNDTTRSLRWTRRCMRADQARHVHTPDPLWPDSSTRS